ncbi:MAG: hypothetical protein AAF687_09380 [Pseudomonadota bacterium]
MARTSQPCPTFPKAETTAIAKRRFLGAAARPVLTSGLAAIALALPAIVQAQGQCPAVQAIISDDARALNGLGITINGSGSLDVTYLGQVGILRDADSCQIDPPSDTFDLGCTWYFSALETEQAEREFDGLLKGLNGCFPVKLEQKDPRTYSAEELERLGAEYGQSYVEFLRNTETVQDHSQIIELATGDEVEVRLALKRNIDSGQLRLRANVYRD